MFMLAQQGLFGWVSAVATTVFGVVVLIRLISFDD